MAHVMWYTSATKLSLFFVFFPFISTKIINNPKIKQMTKRKCFQTCFEQLFDAFHSEFGYLFFEKNA